MTSDQTLAADTAIADKTLEHLEPVTGAVVPRNFVSWKLDASNIDVST